MITIIQATQDHIDEITPLFDLYRNFYKQDSNLQAAKQFLTERIKKEESIVLVAYINDKPVGFTQLYPSFSSVSLRATYILNDLYVCKDQRGNRIGEALLNSAKELCIKKGCKGLALETAAENPAQKLYEKLGWKKDTDSFHYFWTAE